MSSVPDFVDPYVYAGTSVLKNKRGFRSKQTLDAFERRSNLARRVEMAKNPLSGSLDFDYVQRIHKMLFGDVYDWAGQVRTVDIAKSESHFQPTSLISTGSKHIFIWFQKESDLLQTDIDEETFIFQASRLLSDLNYLHPFQEGNSGHLHGGGHPHA